MTKELPWKDGFVTFDHIELEISEEPAIMTILGRFGRKEDLRQQYPFKIKFATTRSYDYVCGKFARCIEEQLGEQENED